jgi:3-oxoacyl-[acyl-carrier protein] reductase
MKGKVAWVLGGSSGLGYATAQSLAREGAMVAISSRRSDVLSAAAETIAQQNGAKCSAIPVDVTEAEGIESAAERVRSEIGEIDVLVANAGGPPPGGFSVHDDETLVEAFSLTTASAWRLAKAVVPSMQRRGGGCVVFLTSSTTKEVIDTLLLSNMMRAAVVGLAKTLSRELGPDGIRVLCVAPGRLATDRVATLDENAAKASGKSRDHVRRENEAKIPLGRYGRPEELGDVVAFLASERASYVTGVTVLVDGGAAVGILS